MRFTCCFFLSYQSNYLKKNVLIIRDEQCEQDVAEEYGVQAMPTFILIKKGKQVDKVVGTKKDDLQNKIEKHRF